MKTLFEVVEPFHVAHSHRVASARSVRMTKSVSLVARDPIVCSKLSCAQRRTFLLFRQAFVFVYRK